MAEYIEREALRSKAVYMHGFGNNKYVPLSAIENAFAADVAPVVRCGKCVFRYCTGRCAKSGLYMDDDGFCSFGREDGE